jgi:ATP-dependent DNA helicase DinG
VRERGSSLTASFFAPRGALSRVLPAYEERPAQRELAEAAREVLEEGGSLLAEAGTGTGKTLAYLLPAVELGRRVVVSTGTKNLQEQLVGKDIPILARALGRELNVAVMKGRANYLCLLRFGSFTKAGSFRRLEEIPLFRAVEGVTRMRQRALSADIVVVNHHLLCADLAVKESSYGAVIPEYDTLIVDEAHLLEDVATQYFGQALSVHRFDDLCRDVERELQAARLDAREVRSEVESVRLRAEGFFRLLASEKGVRLRSNWMSPRTAEEAGALLTRVLGLKTAILAMSERPEPLNALALRAQEIADRARFLMAADDDTHVYFVESRGRTEILRATPIDVSGLLRELLFDQVRSVVLTSATLAVDGGFAYLCSRLGLAPTRELTLASPFDFGRQAVLYVPRDVPEPQSPAFVRAAAREVRELLDISRGRAFVLFTSYANLNAVAEQLAGDVPYPLLMQGEAPKPVLLEMFRRTGNAVLLATSSFWQGVDVVGEQLSCVIIDKLPFASPADPVVGARIDRLRHRGGNPFAEYQVPGAVLTLKQGLGRLIRSAADRGILAVLDSRLLTRGYGRRFLESLPPARLVHELDEVRAFFAGSSPPAVETAREAEGR